MVLLVFLVHLELGTHCTHHCIQRFRLLGFLGFVKTCPGPAVEATDPTRCFASEILVHRATLGILGFLLASLHDPARMRFVKQGHHTSMQNDIQHWHIGKAPVILAAVGSSWQLTLGLIISSPHAWKTSGILYTVTFTSMCQDPMDVFLGMTDFLVPVLGFILISLPLASADAAPASRRARVARTVSMTCCTEWPRRGAGPLCIVRSSALDIS